MTTKRSSSGTRDPRKASRGEVAKRPAEPRRPKTGQHTFVKAFLPHWDRVRWPEIVLAVAVIGAPLALGSVHIEAQLALAGMALVAFAGAAWKLGREGRKVRVGLVSDTNSEILDGLDVGETVVADAGTSLHDGDRVKIMFADELDRQVR